MHTGVALRDDERWPGDLVSDTAAGWGYHRTPPYATQSYVSVVLSTLVLDKTCEIQADMSVASAARGASSMVLTFTRAVTASSFQVSEFH